MSIDTTAIRKEVLDASEHLFQPHFDCCSGHRLARTRIIDLCEALEDARAEVERLRALVEPEPATERFLIDRYEDVWREDGDVFVDRHGQRLSRAEVGHQFGPVAFGTWSAARS